MPYDTDNWPFVPAKHFTSLKREPKRRVRVLVVHTMEFPEKMTAARDVARYFSTTNTKASAHVCIDHREIIQCVKDSDVAWAAPGCNSDGIQIELTGYARQTAAQWADEYSMRMLNLAAKACAQYCRKYDIPARRLDDVQLKAGLKGIVGHSQVSAVYKKSDHTDPGPNFPWLFFLMRVSDHLKAIKKVHP